MTQRGCYLMVEGFQGSKACLGDVGTVYRFLESAPMRIGMTPIAPPLLKRHCPPPKKGEEVSQEWGISGVALIAESHIAVHTWPEKRFATVTICSCKPFDEAKVLNYVRRSFGFESTQSGRVERPWAEEVTQTETNE